LDGKGALVARKKFSAREKLEKSLKGVTNGSQKEGKEVQKEKDLTKIDK